MNICAHKNCTGCSACVEACPRNCIQLIPDELDVLYPKVDSGKCIKCGLCQKTCPNNAELPYKEPLSVYAAWSTNSEERLTSASGGVAYELYSKFLSNNAFCAGVILDSEGCSFIPITNEKELDRVKNSKYVFSYTNGIYAKVKESLKDNKDVLFIGLPCQVAGLYAYLKKEYDNLYTVDLICHGVAPFEYFRQYIEKKCKSKNGWSEILFRDPKYKTKNYFFTIKDKKGIEVYKKPVCSLDSYQLGFHRSLIYRENCYSCKYAQSNRVGDLTIGDFSGIGKETPVSYSGSDVSCVICNSPKGEFLISQIKNQVVFHERPMAEAFKYERQLIKPSSPHPNRGAFLKKYSETKSFEYAANASLRGDKIEIFLSKQYVINTIKSIVPISIVNFISRILHGQPK